MRSWSSQSAFLIAAIGAAVGLGNIWRFPYVAGSNGGGAFVLMYIGFVILLCVPMVAAELYIGRRGQAGPVKAVKTVSEQVKGHPFWQVIGLNCVLISLLVFAFYSVVAGWSLEYLWIYLSDQSSILTNTEKPYFSQLLASPGTLIFWQATIILVTLAIAILGIRKGLEPVLKFLMLGLVVILLILMLMGAWYGDMFKAMSFLYQVDFSKVNAEVALLALGQAFFSVAIGGGAMMTYGAYLNHRVSLIKLASIICLADTLVALVAGLAIFPFVFALGFEPDQGAGLIFNVLPQVLADFSWGHALGIAFFLLFTLAALSTTVALLEPIVAWLEDTLNHSRTVIVVFACMIIFIFGVFQSLSFNHLKEFIPLWFIPAFSEMNLFSLTEYLVSTVLVPLNCLLIALFVGWVYIHRMEEHELGFKRLTAAKLWHQCIRFPAPMAIISLLIMGLASH